MKRQVFNPIREYLNQFPVLLVMVLTLAIALVSCEKLSLTFGDDEDKDEYEPNNERSQAYTIELDKVYTAQIMPQDDDDWFKFTTKHGSETYDNTLIRVFNVSSDLLIHLEVYNESGQSLTTFGAITGGQSVSYTISSPGATFFIRFSGWDGYGLDHTSTGYYSFEVQPQDDNDEFAPNHTIETAAGPMEFGKSYQGVLVSQYEDDFFKFTGPDPLSSNSYTIKLSNVSSDLKAHIEVYGADKSSIMENGTSTGGADLTQSLTIDDAEFYIRISGWDGVVNDHKSRGSYTLEVVHNN